MAAPCRAAHEGVTDFILKHGGSAEQAQAPKNGCFQTERHLICYDARTYNAAQSDPQTRQALLRGLALRTKHDLYTSLLNASQTKRFKNSTAVQNAYLSGVNEDNGNYTLKALEFVTFAEGNILEAIAAAPYAGSLRTIEAAYAQRDFSERYCATLMPKARELYGQKRYAETLTILKELHVLKWARADAYLLACFAFIENNEPEEAGKLADEVKKDLDAQLTADLAEQLGDVYMALHREAEAEQAYRLAASRL